MGLVEGGAPQQILPVGQQGGQFRGGFEGIITLVTKARYIHLHRAGKLIIVGGLDDASDRVEEKVLKARKEALGHRGFVCGIWTVGL